MTEAKAKTVAAKKTEKKSGTYIECVGKRKTSSARVRMFKNGTGEITVNDMPMNKYFATPLMQMVIVEPLKGVSMETAFDFTVKVNGGGKQGQAEAVRHGIARTLLEFDKDLRPVLKTQHWLTRDARQKERKKPGLKRARRAPQWSKR